MDTARRNIRCQVYLHPAAASNPDAIRAVQQATCRLIVLKGGRPTFASTPLPKPLFLDDIDDNGPWGGAA